MGATGCRPSAIAVTQLLATAEVQKTFRALRATGAQAEDYVEAMAGFAEPDVARTIRDEFGELPSLTVTTVVEAWALADAAGKAFEVVSAAPLEPLEFARRRRVRLAIDVEDDRVTVTLSHIPTRHAGWYRPVALTA